MFHRAQLLLFTTAEHAIDPEQRNEGMEIAKPIAVGNSVWVGAGTTVLAGVSIGDNTVIGAGSVVTKVHPSQCSCRRGSLPGAASYYGTGPVSLPALHRGIAFFLLQVCPKADFPGGAFARTGPKIFVCIPSRTFCLFSPFFRP